MTLPSVCCPSSTTWCSARISTTPSSTSSSWAPRASSSSWCCGTLWRGAFLDVLFHRSFTPHFYKIKAFTSVSAISAHHHFSPSECIKETTTGQMFMPPSFAQALNLSEPNTHTHARGMMYMVRRASDRARPPCPTDEAIHVVKCVYDPNTSWYEYFVRPGTAPHMLNLFLFLVVYGMSYVVRGVVQAATLSF